MIPKLEPVGGRSIFLDRSLEEICRLGGTGSIALPDGFGTSRRYSLPTSLSATATYLLQHGTFVVIIPSAKHLNPMKKARFYTFELSDAVYATLDDVSELLMYRLGANYPGLFRISGQSSTVNTLYDYYAFQFAQAGSPSKVQETVGSSLLPTHIEHSVPDVASVFKKIVTSLPGGLLGSLELFNALRNIFFNLASGPERSDDSREHLQARLIALAISSVRSTRRAALIQAVVGMAAYFGGFP